MMLRSRIDPIGVIAPSRHAGWFRSAIRELYHYGRTDPGAAGVTAFPLPTGVVARKRIGAAQGRVLAPRPVPLARSRWMSALALALPQARYVRCRAPARS